MALMFGKPGWLEQYGWQIIVLVCLSQGLLIVGLLIQRSRRKQAEERLKRHRVVADAVIQNLPVLYYLCDEAGHLFRWNRTFEETSEYSFSEIGQMSALDFVAEADKSAYLQQIQKVLSTGKSHLEASFLTKSGSRIPYYFTEVLVQI